MKALVKNSHQTSIQDVSVPELDEINTILIKVLLSGICRTDINVSNGVFPSAERITLGHEFYGEIVQITDTASRFNIGDKVTINPCQFGEEKNKMCGVDVDGAFAEYIKVPEHTVYKLPESLSPRLSAYVEPVAASLAVFNAAISPHEKGCIYGQNRIAVLTQKIMQLKGFNQIEVKNNYNELDENQYDYIIETGINTDDLTNIITALKHQGTLVLKSRQIKPVEIIIHELVKKEIKFQAVHYGNYDEAIELLSTGKLDLGDLTGQMFELTDFETAFSVSQQSESQKCYFKLN